MVPDKIPPSTKEPSEEMRRERALANVRKNLVDATKRLNEFLVDKSPAEVIRRIHTAKTEIRNDSDEPEVVTYYSLWTDFSDMRLTADGQLLECNYPEKYTDVEKYSVDRSQVVSFYNLRRNEKYKTIHLLSLTNQLDKFLQSDKQ